MNLPPPHDNNSPSASSHLAHHFDSLSQQFDAAKLGMWLFIATEILLFGGLFCLYAVYRVKNPAMFEYGSTFLDTSLGATNTCVLILSSLSMALGVGYARQGNRDGLTVCLSLTLLCAAGFLGIKYVEYEHKIHDNVVWGLTFYENPHPPAVVKVETGGDAVETGPLWDPVRGKELWIATCRTCHGVAGEGELGQGKDIRTSEYIDFRTDDELVAFIKIGRMPFDPLNETGIQMPPRGGNQLLDDEALHDIVAYIREFVSPPGTILPDPRDASSTEKELFVIPNSSIPMARTGPAGMNSLVLNAIEQGTEIIETTSEPAPHHTEDPDRPRDAHLFFGIYYLMTGLHGIHVLIGMGVMIWLLVRTRKGEFGPEYYTPVDLAGLYWHVVDVIWIFLFPLFYLIA